MSLLVEARYPRDLPRRRVSDRGTANLPNGLARSWSESGFVHAYTPLPIMSLVLFSPETFVFV